MDYSLLGSRIHEILQARIPEWVAIYFSNCKVISLQLNKLIKKKVYPYVILNKLCFYKFDIKQLYINWSYLDL